MDVTLAFLRERFEHFNRLCFGGELPLPRFQLSTARTFMGQLHYRRRRLPDGSDEAYDFTLKVSVRFTLTETEVEDTLLHEMIHYYIALNRLQDTSTHGALFRRMMNTINRRWGRHLTVACRNRDILSTDTLRQPHILCVSRIDKGWGITVCASSRALYIARELPSTYRLLSQEWYFSADPYFNRFPRSNKPRIYRVDPEELKPHLATARRLKYDSTERRFSEVRREEEASPGGK